jgi:hypothetical protein
MFSSYACKRNSEKSVVDFDWVCSWIGGIKRKHSFFVAELNQEYNIVLMY